MTVEFYPDDYANARADELRRVAEAHRAANEHRVQRRPLRAVGRMLITVGERLAPPDAPNNPILNDDALFADA